VKRPGLIQVVHNNFHKGSNLNNKLFFGKDETIVSFTITQKFTQELVPVGILGLVLMLMQIL